MFDSLNITSININGINNEKKQLMLINHLIYNKIDIMLLQEHNIRDIKNVSPKINEKYTLIINLAINHKGGTAILIDKRLDIKIKNHEMSADSRIISALLEFDDKPLHLLNIYAPSGSKNTDRDQFFN